MRLIATFVLIMNLLIACQPPGSISQEQRQIAEVVAITEQDRFFQQYVQIQDTEIAFEQEQWTKIESLDSLEGYRHLEVYNVYEAEDGSKEYYVSEFELLLRDTIQRQLISDYQVIVKKDTAYIQLSTENDFRLSQKFEYQIKNKIYKVYKLFGYAHKSDKDPVHYKYWSPDFGTLMIFSGQNESFELKKGRGEEEIIQVLLKEIKGEMEVRRM